MYSIFRRKTIQKEEDDPSEYAKVSQLRAALGPLSGRNLQYCTDACLRRYLEARNWNIDEAKKMLQDSLQWRNTYKPEEIRWDEVADVGENGLVSIADFCDRQGRVVLIMRPGMQKTMAGEGNLRHLVHLVEKAVHNLPEGQEQMTWLIDFTDWTLNTDIPIKVARGIINVLQNHYPERLALVVLYSPPRIFEAFWKVVKYFVDTKTAEKNKFVYPNDKASEELMKLYFDAENLPDEFGGKKSLKYDHKEFSKLMVHEDEKLAEFWGFNSKPSHVADRKSGKSEDEDPNPPVAV